MCPKRAIPCNLLDPPEPARTTRKFRNLGVAPATVAPPRNQLNGSKLQENRAPWPGARPRPPQRVPFASAWTSSARSAPRARVSLATDLSEPRAKLRWAPARGACVQTLRWTVNFLINISKRDRRVSAQVETESATASTAFLGEAERSTLGPSNQLLRAPTSVRDIRFSIRSASTVKHSPHPVWLLAGSDIASRYRLLVNYASVQTKQKLNFRQKAHAER